MLELAQTIMHKAILHILPAGSTRGRAFTDLVLGILRSEIERMSSLNLSAEEFSTDGVYASEDSAHHLHIACVPFPPDHRYPIYWAMRLTSRDPVLRHRVHTLHLGLQQTSDFEITLYIANTCSDDLGGRLTTARPVAKKLSPLVPLLLTHPDLRCVTGNYVLLNESIMLTNESMEFVLGMLLDPGRTLPVLLVTCPDLIDPDALHACLQGNAVVCFTDDPQIVACLNENLPENSLVNMDTIHIYLPFSDRYFLQGKGHRILSLNDIYRLTPQGIYHLCYQAYCAYLRKSERSTFVTVDLCIAINQRRQFLALQGELSDARLRIQSLDVSLKAVRDAKEQLNRDYKALQNEQSMSNTREYEALLEENMKELDSIKEALRSLTSQLYNPSEDPELPKVQDDLVKDLLIALRYRLAHQK